jgi:hypothetical protein
MTTYKCNLCEDVSFGKVSGLKRHQTRKHPGSTDLAIIEVSDNGKEATTPVEAPAPKRASASRKRVAASSRRTKATATKTTSPKATVAQAEEPREIVIQRQTDQTVTIKRELFEVLMKLAGVPAP